MTYTLKIAMWNGDDCEITFDFAQFATRMFNQAIKDGAYSVALYKDEQPIMKYEATND